jgi:hypothetical protein
MAIVLETGDERSEDGVLRVRIDASNQRAPAALACADIDSGNQRPVSTRLRHEPILAEVSLHERAAGSRRNVVMPAATRGPLRRIVNYISDHAH